MFSFAQSPCIYECRQPTLDTFSPLSMVPDPKRRRMDCQRMRYPNTRPAKAPVKWDVTEKDNEYVVSFFKRLDGDVLGNAVHRHLQKLREERQPSYRIVRDFFGNEYYVENRFDNDAFIREAMASLDLSSIQAQVSKQSFKDFEITLNHRGDKLVVVSKRDEFYQEFALGVEFEDVYIAGFEMVNDNVAALRVGVRKPCSRNMLPVNFSFIDNCAEKRELERNQSNEEEEDDRANYEVSQKAAQEAYKLQQRGELARKEKAKKEAVEAEWKVQEEAAKAKAAKAKAAKRIAHRNKKQAVMEKKAFLVEQKRKLREQKEAEEAGAATLSRTQTPSPSPVVININISAPQEKSIATASAKADRGRSHSPVLEDVDDEELQRYRQSLDHTPRGSSIVDNV
ncbi:uncharacterized protein LALA0_S06e06810g [Lachancea lanzarotensis]|uniref:LALA0S06e06810g1_1 n=1 Tax=Lachancea lanzarotensis TaxID=1245769 RepID=A0A0C7N4N4_9SACH|nr:uncharacterized protein LALA0_S06e06810g [Lachancea lanzarotensis]CEP62917.1 LALA0S06e06810g1_1 [Lachancea lanzarotensis]